MENEKRLIDANALPISKEYCVDEAGFGATFYVVHKDAIDNAPTVDAVEVVHGRWITEYWKSGYIKRCNCSLCGESPKDAYKPDNYCPNCGAKMDGDGNGNS